MKKSYADDITPVQAYELLEREEKSLLVDVRTEAEWHYVGRVNLDKIVKKPIYCQWRLYPTMNINREFLSVLQKYVNDTDISLIFLCRVGGRSAEAAEFMAQQGFTKCYNVLGGFEGEKNQFSHRGTISGWKSANLPWEQD